MKCKYGCGKDAKYQLKNGNWICEKSPNSCPVNKEKNSNGIKKGIKSGKINFSKRIQYKKPWNKGKILLSLDKIFCKNSYYAGEYIKKIIFDKKLIEYKCNKCGIINWNEENICLELDHINGINFDNRIENLRFLCPNCHSQTKTFRGRNMNNGKQKVSDEILIKALQESTNIRKALINVNLSPRGANYKRCYKLMFENKINMNTSIY